MKKIRHKKIRHVDAIKVWWAFTIAAIILLVILQLAGVNVD